MKLWSFLQSFALILKIGSSSNIRDDVVVLGATIEPGFSRRGGVGKKS